MEKADNLDDGIDDDTAQHDEIPGSNKPVLGAECVVWKLGKSVDSLEADVEEDGGGHGDIIGVRAETNNNTSDQVHRSSTSCVRFKDESQILSSSDPDKHGKSQLKRHESLTVTVFFQCPISTGPFHLAPSRL